MRQSNQYRDKFSFFLGSDKGGLTLDHVTYSHVTVICNIYITFASSV